MRPFKVKTQSLSMRFFGPLILIIPVLIAFYFCEWQVVVAFILAVIILPFALLFLTKAHETLLHQKPMDLNGLFEVGTLFAVAGILIYFSLIIPVYYMLKSAISIPLVFSFPLSVSVILFTLFTFFTTRSWGYKEFLAITACSILHALFIIWLISKLKSISAWWDT